MLINMIADSSVTSAPSGFASTIQAAATLFASYFTDTITINLTFGWGTYNNAVDSNLTGGTGAEGGPDGYYQSYSQVLSWLTAASTSVTDRSALAYLPSSNASTFFVSAAQEKAFGALSGTSTAIDGSIGFGTNSSSSFWFEAAMHEIGHAMGRMTQYYTGDPVILDLMRYGSQGAYQWTGGQSAYFSVDGGKTDLANYSNISDYSDLAVDGLTPADPFDYATDGSTKVLTTLDQQIMDAIGFTRRIALATTQPTDFNNDGKGDILLSDSNTGACYLWETNGTNLSGSGFVGYTPGSTWQAKTTGDFNADGNSDILLQNSTNGSCYIWETNGTGSLAGGGFVGWSPGVNWNAAATGDFNGDGYSDVVLQNTTNGACYVWELQGTTMVGNNFVGWTPGANWHVKGTGDFNGDGKSDILLQNSDNGACFVWEMNGLNVVSSGFVGWTPGASWQVKGTGDFNGDGYSDILLQNSSDGSLFMWDMKGLNLAGSGFVSSNPGLQWQVAATGDYNGDGKTDILLHNSSTGAYETWGMNGTNVATSNSIGWSTAANWHAVQ